MNFLSPTTLGGRALLVTAAAVSMLVACGGGSDSTVAQAPATPPAQTPPATPPATPPVEAKPGVQIAFMPDIHFHDVYATFKDGSFPGVFNPKTGFRPPSV